MQYRTIFRIIGVLLMVFSLSMLPPFLISFFYEEAKEVIPFISAFGLTLTTGFVFWFLCRHYRDDLKTREGFLIVILFWMVLSLFAAIPFMISAYPHETITDAVFESVSGFTTTGASVVIGVEQLSHAMRFYRQQLQFFGGMGIIVLAVAILPMLGVGGLQMYRAETPGPVKDNKLTPRITETAKTLWYIYVGLTLLCALSYWLAGMNMFDAVGESFATISTGGFSMHDSSFSYYHSNTIETVAIVFMLLGGTNFALHFLALREKSIYHYWRDEEFRAYILILMVISLFVLFELFNYRVFPEATSTVVKCLFQVVSMMTTTGFVSAPFSTWPSYLPILIMVGALIGGCAASTSGGIKVMRILLLKKQTSREIQRLIHPKSVTTLKFGGQILPEHVMQSMWAFIAAYIVIFVVLYLLLMATGLDFLTAFGALAATIANTGATVGKVANTFIGLNVATKWLLIVAMLIGRLEIFTFLVLFSPSFWRK